MIPPGIDCALAGIDHLGIQGTLQTRRGIRSRKDRRQACRACYMSSSGVVSSSGSSGMVEKYAFSRIELGAFRKSSGRVQGRFGKLEETVLGSFGNPTEAL
jgi:hypothetical protein